MAVEHHPRARRAAPRAAPRAARTSPACTCSATAAGASSTSARRSRSASASPATSRNPTMYGTTALTEEIDHIEALVVVTEAEALLTEQNFIKQYKPKLQHPAARRQVVPVHRDQPRRGLPARLLHARAPQARARLLRPVLVRQARARHARPAGQDLPVPLLRGHRARPPLRLAVPGLLHQALRGALRRLRVQGGVPRGDRRRGRVPLRPLQADRARPRAQDVLRRRRARLRAGDDRAQPPAGRQARCWSASAWPRAAPAPTTRSPSPSRARRPTRRSSRSATACSRDRQSFYLENQAEQEPAIVAEEFMLQYYASALSIPPLIVVAGRRWPRARSSACWARCWPSAAAAQVEIRASERGGKRRILDLARAQRAARARPGEAQGRAPAPAARGLAERPAGRAGAGHAAGADRVLRHLARRRHAHRRLDGRVRGRRAEEERLPALHAFARSTAAMISPRWRRS